MCVRTHANTRTHTHTNKAQELQSRIRALNNEIVALNGHQGIDDTRWHSVSTLPTESAFLVVEAIDYLKSTMPVDELVQKMDDLVQLRWTLDAQLLQSVAQAAKADFTARDDLKVLGTGDVGKIEDWYKETYDAIVLARELQEQREDAPTSRVGRTWRQGRIEEIFGPPPPLKSGEFKTETPADYTFETKGRKRQSEDPIEGQGRRPNDPVEMKVPVLDWQAFSQPVLVGGTQRVTTSLDWANTAFVPLRHPVDIDRLYNNVERLVGKDPRIVGVNHVGAQDYVIKAR